MTPRSISHQLMSWIYVVMIRRRLDVIYRDTLVSIKKLEGHCTDRWSQSPSPAENFLAAALRADMEYLPHDTTE